MSKKKTPARIRLQAHVELDMHARVEYRGTTLTIYWWDDDSLDTAQAMIDMAKLMIEANRQAKARRSAK